MIRLKETMELTGNFSIQSFSDTLGKKIRGNYRTGNTVVSRLELFYLLTVTPDIFVKKNCFYRPIFHLKNKLENRQDIHLKVEMGNPFFFSILLYPGRDERERLRLGTGDKRVLKWFPGMAGKSRNQRENSEADWQGTGGLTFESAVCDRIHRRNIAEEIVISKGENFFEKWNSAVWQKERWTEFRSRIDLPGERWIKAEDEITLPGNSLPEHRENIGLPGNSLPEHRENIGLPGERQSEFKGNIALAEERRIDFIENITLQTERWIKGREDIVRKGICLAETKGKNILKSEGLAGQKGDAILRNRSLSYADKDIIQRRINLADFKREILVQRENLSEPKGVIIQRSRNLQNTKRDILLHSKNSSEPKGTIIQQNRSLPNYQRDTLVQRENLSELNREFILQSQISAKLKTNTFVLDKKQINSDNEITLRSENNINPWNTTTLQTKSTTDWQNKNVIEQMSDPISQEESLIYLQDHFSSQTESQTPQTSPQAVIPAQKEAQPNSQTHTIHTKPGQTGEHQIFQYLTQVNEHNLKMQECIEQIKPEAQKEVSFAIDKKEAREKSLLALRDPEKALMEMEMSNGSRMLKTDTKIQSILKFAEKDTRQLLEDVMAYPQTGQGRVFHITETDVGKLNHFLRETAEETISDQETDRETEKMFRDAEEISKAAVKITREEMEKNSLVLMRNVEELVQSKMDSVSERVCRELERRLKNDQRRRGY